LIAALAAIEEFSSHDTEGNRADPGSKNTRRAADQDLARHDGPERRKKGDDQRPGRECDYTGGYQRALGVKAVNQRAGRRLRKNPGDPAHR
jgi:hypothetical protein